MPAIHLGWPHWISKMDKWDGLGPYFDYLVSSPFIGFSPQASLSLNISFPQEAFPSSPRQKYCLLFLLWATTWNQTHCSANWRQKQTWGSRCLLRPGVYSDGGVNGGEYGNQWSNRMTPDKHYGCKIMLWEGGLPWKQYIELLERSCPQRQAYLMPQAKALTGCISRFICKKKLGIDLTAILNCKFLENKNIFFSPPLCNNPGDNSGHQWQKSTGEGDVLESQRAQVHFTLRTGFLKTPFSWYKMKFG